MTTEGSRRPASICLLAALATGIACGDAWPSHWAAGVATGILTLTLMAATCRTRRGRGGAAFGAGCLLALCATGFLLASARLASVRHDFTGEPGFYQVRIVDHPEEKPRSVLCHAVLQGEGRGDTLRPRRDRKHFLLYLAKDTAACALRRGDELLIHTRLSPPASTRLPDAFDYGRYLTRHGVSGTAYVAGGHWQRTGHSPRRSFTQRAADMRVRVVGLFRRLGFQGDELAIVSALTVGAREELSEEMTETYSVAGASHVLAISGMHIAFIYGLLHWLLSPLWKRRARLKPFLLLTVTAFLWGFAYVTGWQPSVVRAVVMCTLLIAVSLRPERASAFDTMTAAAFLMLLYHPLWLFDVGFQLSFLAVWGLLVIHPKLNALCPTRHRPLRKVWELMSLSVAAQISTAPLVMLCFARFPTHFLLTNLWVVPVSSLVMYAAMLLLTLTPLPAVQMLLAPAVVGLVRVQNAVLRWIEQLPYASIDGIWLGTAGTCLLYLCILQGCRAWSVRTPRSVGVLLGLVLAFAVHHSLTAVLDTPRPSIALYNVRGCPAIHCLAGGSRSWLVCADSTQTADWLCRTLAPHWNRQRLAPPVLVRGRHEEPSLLADNQMVTYGGKLVCLLNDARWRGKTSAVRLDVDCLYIAKGYRGDLDELMPLFSIREVVLDASIPDYYRQRIQEDCTRLRIPCRLLRQDDMLILPL